MSEGRRPAPLARRLAAAFVAVAVAVVALLAVALVLVEHGDVAHLSAGQVEATTRAVDEALSSAYAEHHGWEGADLTPAADLASASAARIEVVDDAGRPIDIPLAGGGAGASVETVPITVDGRRVGTLRIRFARGGLTDLDRRLRHDLWLATVVAAVVAAAVALGAGVLISGRLTRPLVALRRAVGAVEGGDRGVRVGPIGGSREITELAGAFDRMAANLDHQEDLRHALVADVAHELRTPLAVLQASTEAVIDGVREPDVELVESMHQEVLRLGQRVEDLAALTAAETAGLHLARRRVDLASVAGEAAAQLEEQFREAGVSLAVDLTPVEVDGDADRLFQIVSNLLANALKFTAAGGSVRLRVGAGAGGVGGAGAEVEVIDDGVGIPADELDQVFERFWRGRAAAGREGSGVGLAIVAELARAHGGRVDVTSTAGRGSTFRVHLPAASRSADRSSEGV